MAFFSTSSLASNAPHIHQESKNERAVLGLKTRRKRELMVRKQVLLTKCVLRDMCAPILNLSNTYNLPRAHPLHSCTITSPVSFPGSPAQTDNFGLQLEDLFLKRDVPAMTLERSAGYSDKSQCCANRKDICKQTFDVSCFIFCLSDSVILLISRHPNHRWQYFLHYSAQ